MIIRIGPRAHERGQLKSPFIQRELEGTNEDVKQPQRERVARFFAPYLNVKRPRCFCLPGARWGFENELERHTHRTVEFIGVERNYTILEAGLKHIPGRHVLYTEEPMKQRVFRGYSTDRAKVLWCKASEMMTLRRGDKPSKAALRDWFHAYKRWSCAWLDFSAPINDEAIRCCKRLEAHLDEQLPAVPVAITFLAAREEPHITQSMRLLDIFRTDPACPLEPRVTLLRAAWESCQFRRVEVVDSWRYLSAGGTPMGVLTCLFRRR